MDSWLWFYGAVADVVCPQGERSKEGLVLLSCIRVEDREYPRMLGDRLVEDTVAEETCIADRYALGLLLNGS